MVNTLNKLKSTYLSQTKILKNSLNSINISENYVKDLSLVIKDINYVLNLMNLLIESDFENINNLISLIDRLIIIDNCISDMMQFLISRKKQDLNFNYTLIDIKDSIHILEKSTFEFTSNALQD